jgi:hypothetical protein
MPSDAWILFRTTDRPLKVPVHVAQDIALQLANCHSVQTLTTGFVGDPQLGLMLRIADISQIWRNHFYDDDPEHAAQFELFSAPVAE